MHSTSRSKKNISRDTDTSATSPSLKRKRTAEEDDPKLREFLNTMQAPTRRKTWADTGTDLDTSLTASKTKSQDVDMSEEKPQKRAKAEKTEINAQISASRIAEENSTEPAAEPQTNEENADAVPKSDADWLRSRTSRLLGLLDDEEEEDAERSKVQPNDTPSPVRPSNQSQPEVDESDDPEQADPQESSLAREITDENINLIRDTGRLFIRNLAYNTTEEDLQSLFGKFGKLEEVRFELFSLLPFHFTTVA